MTEELKEILALHLRKYPSMQAEDVIKLLFQNEFGPAHAVRDFEQAAASIRKECGIAVSEKNEEDLFTSIGNDLVRIDLGRASECYTPEQITDWFLQTADTVCGTMEAHLENLTWIDRNFEAFPFAFSKETWNETLASHYEQGCSQTHHSLEYNRIYHPHYRLIRQGIWMPK